MAGRWIYAIICQFNQVDIAISLDFFLANLEDSFPYVLLQNQAETSLVMTVI